MFIPLRRVVSFAASLLFASTLSAVAQQSIPQAHIAPDGTNYWLISRNNQLITVENNQISPGLVSAGFIAAKPLPDGKIFVVGTLYAYQGSETQRLVDALNAEGALTIVSIAQGVETTSTALNGVSFQGIDTQDRLFASWSNVLGTINAASENSDFVNPSPLNPDQYIPQPYADFVKQGTFDLVGQNLFRVQFARPDQAKYTVGDLPASVYLGVADTVYIQPLPNNGAYAHVEAAINGNEIVAVIAYLRSRGWTIASQQVHYSNPNNTSQPLYFLQAFKRDNMGTIFDDLYQGFNTLFESERAQQ